MAGGKFKVLRDGVLALPAYLWCRQAEHALSRPTACIVTSSVASTFKLNLMAKGGQFSVVARGHFSVAIYIYPRGLGAGVMIDIGNSAVSNSRSGIR